MIQLGKLKVWARELKAQLLTLWFCRSHPDTPLAAKVCAALVVAYAFSPIDLIPDFIPVLGYLDDLLIVPIGVYLTLRLIPAHVVTESRAKADEWISQRQKKPRSHVAAVVIVITWLALAFWAWTYLAAWLDKT